MNKFPPRLFAHVIATAFLAQPSLAADVPPLTNHTPVCTGFGFDVNKELKLFAGTFRSVTATTTSASAADIDVDQLYVVELADQSKVTLVATPGKSSVAAGSFAGLLKVSTFSASILRATSTQAARLDVIGGGTLRESQRHTGSGNCNVLRKVVEFRVTPGQPLIIQISGSPEKEIKLAVTTA